MKKKLQVSVYHDFVEKIVFRRIEMKKNPWRHGNVCIVLNQSSSKFDQENENKRFSYFEWGGNECPKLDKKLNPSESKGREILETNLVSTTI